MHVSRVSRKFAAIIKFGAHKITSHLLRESTDGELVLLKTRFCPEISAFFKLLKTESLLLRQDLFLSNKKSEFYAVSKMLCVKP